MRGRSSGTTTDGQGASAEASGGSSGGKQGSPYLQAGIPRALAEEIRRVIEENPWLGLHQSLSSFATVACQEKLREIQAQIYQRNMSLENRRAPARGEPVEPLLD